VFRKTLERISDFVIGAVIVWGSIVYLAGCGAAPKDAMPQSGAAGQDGSKSGYSVNAVNFDRSLDDYEPQKNTYNFYFTYKTVHPWWDAVALGMEDAARQYEEKGIIINYEYLAPDKVSAQNQIHRLLEASRRDFDVIGVDVADVEIVTPVINQIMADGEKVMTFSSSDSAKEDGCRRIAYVGNTHNYQDGAELTQALCEKLGYSGKVAVLVGNKGAPCHEDRALGVKDVISRYPDMKIVEVAYDEDSVDKAYAFTQGFLARHKDLGGIICCNMSNPVGAARAVIEAGREKEVAIVGMDHDQEALRYLKDGIIYALGIQDCYSIGFDTVQVAVKIADGLLPGEYYPEKTEEKTTIIYQDEAAAILQTLYGEID
jgi:ribose transport system substrate-binding protein